MTYKILKGNSLDLLPTLADNSIDAIVTDPPYELGFMGKTWDNSGIAYSLELWQQCLRVLKPGGHLLAFSGSRTYHRMVVSIEDAGFEIRDMISWISNKTFPKSLNIGKTIDKIAEADTKKWDGWGTGLKPTVEPIVMARKPVEGTVANNVLTYGTGGLNIDASRIGTNANDLAELNRGNKRPIGDNYHEITSFKIQCDDRESKNAQGRWPANLILDEYTAELLDQQSGQIKGGTWNNTDGARHFDNKGKPTSYETKGKDNSVGGASRFFYVAKASKRDRNEGLDDLDAQRHSDRELADGVGGNNPRNRTNQAKQNFHPTVKPTTLMEYLINLVTPPNGTVLDPFTGSGSTGKAAILQGFHFIGIEMTEEYLPIIEGRLKHAEAIVAEAKEQEQRKETEVLF